MPPYQPWRRIENRGMVACVYSFWQISGWRGGAQTGWLAHGWRAGHMGPLFWGHTLLSHFCISVIHYFRFRVSDFWYNMLAPNIRTWQYLKCVFRWVSSPVQSCYSLPPNAHWKVNRRIFARILAIILPSFLYFAYFLLAGFALFLVDIYDR